MLGGTSSKEANSNSLDQWLILGKFRPFSALISTKNWAKTPTTTLYTRTPHNFLSFGHTPPFIWKEIPRHLLACGTRIPTAVRCMFFEVRSTTSQGEVSSKSMENVFWRLSCDRWDSIENFLLKPDTSSSIKAEIQSLEREHKTELQSLYDAQALEYHNERNSLYDSLDPGQYSISEGRVSAFCIFMCSCCFENS